MRLGPVLFVASILLMAGCSKDSGPVNFNCKVNGSYISGTAVTYYYTTSPPTFQIVLTGPGSQAATIIWYGGTYTSLDSVNGIKGLTAHSYTMPANPLPPFAVAALFTSGYGANSYSTGEGTGTSGTVTITNNTGAGGVISGTFSFNALNSNYPYDTIHITDGSFTNVGISN